MPKFLFVIFKVYLFTNMKRHALIRSFFRIKYTGLLTRLSLAIVSSHLIVSYQEEETFLELLVLPEYYKALGGSIIIATFIIEPIYQINHWLDKRYVWVKSVGRRLKRQILLCFLLPLTIAFTGAAIYFKVNHIHIGNTDYFIKYPFIIAMMILVLNALYIGLDLYKQNKWFYEWKRKIGHRSNAILLEKSKMAQVPDAVLFFSRDRNYFYVDENGEELVWGRGVTETYRLLSQSDYFLANRTDIVRRDNILQVKSATSHRKKLILKVPTGRSILTSQSKTPAFLLWWANETDIDLIEPKS